MIFVLAKRQLNEYMLRITGPACLKPLTVVLCLTLTQKCNFFLWFTFFVSVGTVSDASI